MSLLLHRGFGPNLPPSWETFRMPGILVVRRSQKEVLFKEALAQNALEFLVEFEDKAIVDSEHMDKKLLHLRPFRRPIIPRQATPPFVSHA